MSRQSGVIVQVPDGSADTPALAIGRRDTGFFIARGANGVPTGLKAVVAGVVQGVVAGAPVDGVAAAATVTLNPNVTAGQSVTIGPQTYTFVTALSDAPAVPYEVVIGALKTDSMLSLVKAINGTAAPAEHSATVANLVVTSSAPSGDVITLTARAKGAAGNSLGISNVGAGLANTAFASGVDGTVGSAGDIVTDGTEFYGCLEDAAITDSAKWVVFTTTAI